MCFEELLRGLLEAFRNSVHDAGAGQGSAGQRIHGGIVGSNDGSGDLLQRGGGDAGGLVVGQNLHVSDLALGDDNLHFHGAVLAVHGDGRKYGNKMAKERFFYEKGNNGNVSLD